MPKRKVVQGKGAAAGVVAVIEKEPRSKWRWRFLMLWIIVFTLFTILALRDNRNQGASLSDLQKTNCALKTFLLEARRARLQVAKGAKPGRVRRSNLTAAASYKDLADKFSVTRGCRRGLERRGLNG